MTSAPKPDPDITVFRLDHPMVVLIGVLALSPLIIWIWTIVGAVVRHFNWLDSAQYYIEVVGVAASQLCIGILGVIVLITSSRVKNREGRKQR